MPTGIPVIGNKKSSLAILSYFLKHKHHAASSVIISSLSLTVPAIFQLQSQALS